MTTTALQRTVQLPSGAGMPLLGFGTWQLRGRDATRATGWALETGYRHLDTATIYRNEREVGAAVRNSGIARGDVFLTTKLPPERAGSEPATLRQSLDLLGTDYVDLWLIHWTPNRGIGLDIWEQFIAAQQQGLARDIGVSNYSLEQIDQLGKETGVTPAVNQIEWSPLLYDQQQVQGHRDRGVVLEGYSALKGGTLQHPTIGGIAERLGRTPAQVILRWHLQHEIVVIPKSSDRSRIASNADLDDFELADEDMATLDALGGTG